MRRITQYTIGLVLGLFLATSVSAFEIKFNFDYDDGFADSAERRFVIETAGAIWAAMINEDFPEIPAGTQMEYEDAWDTITWTLQEPIDDLLVIIRAKPQSQPAVAHGTHGGLQDAEHTARRQGWPYRPYLGYIRYKSDANWHAEMSVEANPDKLAGYLDLFEVTMHELSHILGFSTNYQGSYGAMVVGNEFQCDETKAWNDGNHIPLAQLKSHISSSLTKDAPVNKYITQAGSSGEKRRWPGKMEALMLNCLGIRTHQHIVNQYYRLTH